MSENKRRKSLLCRVLLSAAAAVAAAAAAAVSASALDADTVIMRDYVQPDKAGCVTVGISGSYIAGVDDALSKINAARYEACRDGVPNPADPSKKLTLADFVPAQYSSDLEKYARLRAAEAVFTFGHTRPNGGGCFTAEVKSSAEFSYQAESIAWNNTGSVKSGIEQFLQEKENWVNQKAGTVTGHYTQMINPANRYIGFGCFTTKDTTGYSTALCIRYGRSDKNLDGSKGSPVQKAVVPVQIPEDALDNVRIKAVSGSKTIPANGSASFEMRATAEFDFTNGGKKNTWQSDVIFYDAQWASSDSSVATVTRLGYVKAVRSGRTNITASTENDAIRFKVTVNPSIEECTISIPYSSYTYRGRGIRPAVTVKLGSEKLVKGTDYTLTYTNNENVGTGIITIKGIGRLSGIVTRTFKVKPLNLSSSYAKVTIPYASYSYTGTNIRPAVTVAFKDGTVIPRSEYSLVYYNNIKLGNSRASVTGVTENVIGTFSKPFVIKPAKNKISVISSTKGAFKIWWTRASEGASGYQVLYSKDKDFKKDVHSYSSKALDDLSENFSRVPESGETWYVKVRSFLEINNTRYGNYSAVKSITVK